MGAEVDFGAASAALADTEGMDLSMTPSELLAEGFHRLRRIVVTKREGIMLAQCYLQMSADAGACPGLILPSTLN